MLKEKQHILFTVMDGFPSTLEVQQVKGQINHVLNSQQYDGRGLVNSE